MTKKMKGVDSSPYGVYVYAKKHQTLLQDYNELQEVVESSRNKLGNMRQTKMTLLAEVRFLRRRYKYLLKNKSPALPQEKEFKQPQYVTYNKNNTGDLKVNGVEGIGHKLPAVFKPNHKQKVYKRHEVSLHNANLTFDPNHKEKQHTGKIAAQSDPHQYYGNQQERIYYGKGTAMENPSMIFDSSRRKSTTSVKHSATHSRDPAFDLNQISREEEELRENCAPPKFGESMKGFINDDQISDLKLPICRNVGEGSGHAAKRKISWQDPVALRV